MSGLVSSLTIGPPVIPKISVPSDEIYVPFKIKHVFEKRRKEYENISSKFKDKIPVIVESSGKLTPSIDRHKFLVPSDTTIQDLIYVIKKRMKTNLSSDEALFFFINNTIPPMSSLLSQVYKEHQDTDGFLYITYSSESTFG